MPDSRRIHDRRCLERSIHAGFVIKDASSVRFAEDSSQNAIIEHSVIRPNHPPVMPIQWALFEAWKPKDGSVDIHCLLMVPEVAENPQTAGQP